MSITKQLYIIIITNHSINPKTKHIDIRFHFVRKLIKENKIKLQYVKSEWNLEDGFTKFLNNTLMNKFREHILYKTDITNIAN